MRNLLDFLLKYSSVFLFTFLLVISITLLFSNGRFHSSVWFTSANAVSSRIFEMSNGVTGYFNLKTINKSLQQSNAQLENEVLNLRVKVSELEAIINDTIDNSNSHRFDYILSTVLNNSTRHPRNYFTIDKGLKDGIKSGMGVVDQNGVVGVVNVTGNHTSRVISLLNTTQHISVRLKNTDIVGSLVWKVNDPKIAYMEEIPRHRSFNIGDTVVTSGFSTTFPADLPVGVVMGKVKTENENFYVIKVRLTSDFKNLSAVRVLRDSYKEEMDSLVNLDINS